MLNGVEVDFAGVRGEESSSSAVRHERELLAFTEAVMRRDAAATATTRKALEAVLGAKGVVDTAAVIVMFNIVDRLADAIGIPLDEGGRELREAVGIEVGLEAFHPDQRAAR